MTALKSLLPKPLRYWLRSRYQAAEKELLVLDRVTDWSVLRKIRPHRRNFGSARGECIDRYYIEKFLAANQRFIRGHVAEIGSDRYTRQFGGDRVEKSDVIDINEENDRRTITLDLTECEAAPSQVYDCIICTQTLFQIYDYTSAIRTLFKMLRTDGVLLATFPGICQSVRGGMLSGAGSDWWRFTSLSATRLFSDIFGERNVNVQAFGNVVSAVAFLHGLVQAELTTEELEYHDPEYEMLLGVAATRRAAR